jgi:hypothetical protein
MQSHSPEGQEREELRNKIMAAMMPLCHDHDFWRNWPGTWAFAEAALRVIEAEQARAALAAASAPKEPAEPTDGQTERCPDCGVLMEGVFFHFKDCPRSARLLVRANHSGVAAIPQAEKEAGSKCQPDGLMFDAFGNPRVKFARVVFEGSTCVCRLSEAADMAPTGDDADAYEIKEVWLSEQEFAALPEFEGW